MRTEQMTQTPVEPPLLSKDEGIAVRPSLNYLVAFDGID
jgi:hypothetical protein